ncbi:hypothetical protein DFJ58DRAFT_725805 [Suillus subalutaceus]|uniref:uncharacterized protein n=1 Tax=Suillus subalutaceus TaxID=48586 RepID=UPI001B86FE8B|nr:uncharacterized protein DFJ58DRAFT_725805 [Suillus subalutaceus]KAG1861111.1 hypothetical protein DFJ58DRAFT_725805 [Suillus subalutaceus]
MATSCNAPDRQLPAPSTSCSPGATIDTTSRCHPPWVNLPYVHSPTPQGQRHYPGMPLPRPSMNLVLPNAHTLGTAATTYYSLPLLTSTSCTFLPSSAPRMAVCNISFFPWSATAAEIMPTQPHSSIVQVVQPTQTELRAHLAGQDQLLNQLANDDDLDDVGDYLSDSDGNAYGSEQKPIPRNVYYL